MYPRVYVYVFMYFAYLFILHLEFKKTRKAIFVLSCEDSYLCLLTEGIVVQCKEYWKKGL